MQDLLHESTHIQEVKEKENAPKKQQKKSSSDNLSDEQKTELIEKLRLLLTDTDVLCASDLSEQNLAQQIGTNISYLSRAINDVYNCNFNNLVNNLRVQEACRRIDDKDNFGQFSMEGIGQSVGFNSRSTFNAAFKRVTGLTPSEYQREARKND